MPHDDTDHSPLARMDRTRPSIARSYDAFLDGKDNFEIDRVLMDKMLEVYPQFKDMALENRRWLVRAVRWMATAGIDQFLDLGCGLPTQQNTHEVAQNVNPTATVCYVDNDPAVAAFGRALLEGNEYTHFAEADLTDPEALFAHDIVTRYLDMSRPIGLMHCATFHHVSPEQQPYDLMQRYIAHLPGGSYLALTHVWDPETDLTQTVRDLERAVRGQGLDTGWFRTRNEIQSFFDGLEMVEPGLVRLYEWWPDGPDLHEPTEADDLVLAGVARKP